MSLLLRWHSQQENNEKSRFPFFDPIPTSEAHISVRLSATSDSLCQNGSQIYDIFNYPQRNINLNLSLNSEALDRARNYKYMASILDKNLSYKGHINHIATTVNNKTCTLRLLGLFLPQQTMIMLYKSLILSHIDYDAMVWCSASDSEPQPLQDLQTKH